MRSLTLGIATLVSAAFASTATPASAQELPAPPMVSVQIQAGVSGYDAAAGYDAAYDNAYAAQPQAGQWHYHGPHPVAWDHGGGFCNLAGEHDHDYPVFDANLYRQTSGSVYFVGDPADFGYSGASYAYAGVHPIAATYGGGYCHMGWGHRHLFAPVGAGWAWRGNAWAWGGAFAPSYWADRPRWSSYYDNYYRRTYYGGAYYRLRPPHLYVGVGRPWAPAWRPYRYAAPVRYAAPAYGYRPAPVRYAAPAYGYHAPRPFAAPGYHGGFVGHGYGGHGFGGHGGWRR